MVTYTYNPHQHVKIWLSKNPQLFMNLENQIRLIEMREKNPHDLIHLIYDASLLNQDACIALEEFCQENTIIAVDADQLRSQLDSENERILFDFYKDEIQHLQAGGNLAVASDILRWLSPVYRLGSYSDFDFPVDTSSLPAHVPVNAPLLLNIGTLKIGKMEFILANNDYIAVVDPFAAKEYIERVQHGMIAVLREYATDFIEKTERALKQGRFINHYLLQFMKNRAEVSYIVQSNTIAPNTSTSRNVRNYIGQIMSQPALFINFNRQVETDSDHTVINALRKKLKKELNLVKFLFFKKEYEEIKSILKQSDEAFVAYLMKRELDLYLKSIIVCTTGPVQISNALFDAYVLDAKSVVTKVRPLSFNHYNLHKAFRSPNSIPMHENIIGMLRFMGVSEGEVNDSSWLESGRILQEHRTKKLEVKQQELAVHLPESFLELKQEIILRLEKISEKSHKRLFNQQRTHCKNTLEELLHCYHVSDNQFDVTQFKRFINTCDFRQLDIVSRFYFHHTKRLITNMGKLSHDAVLFRLTKNKKISLS